MKSGVNMVSEAKHLICLLFCLLLFACGSDESKTESGATIAVNPDSTTATDQKERNPEYATIEGALNEAIVRLRHGDKSGLYENEFEYLKDDMTFDDYLKTDQMRWAQADTVKYVEVRHIEFCGQDSAIVDVTVHFEGLTGKESFHRDKLIVYYHQGRWIKPTVSVIDQQRYYDEKMRVADSAANAEDL